MSNIFIVSAQRSMIPVATRLPDDNQSLNATLIPNLNSIQLTQKVKSSDRLTTIAQVRPTRSYSKSETSLSEAFVSVYNKNSKFQYISTL